MALLEFRDIAFCDDKDTVRLVFLRIFETHIDKADLSRIASFKLGEHHIDFKGITEKEANNKFMLLLAKSFDGLKSKLTGHRAVYIHRNSGIPLIGTLYSGIVDRGTNMIEVKPITGCNINCVFCSVDEGASSRKLVDFVVETDYLVDELRRLVEFKGEKVDVFINTHGEPLLYSNMIDLVKGIRSIDLVRTISIITNGTLLTKSLADELIGVGLDQLNISINAFHKDKAKGLAGTPGYDIEQVLDIARYVSKKIRLIIAPVWIKGLNDDEIPLLIGFAKEIGATVGIQNYMLHRMGRKVAKELEWEKFYAKLDVWEKETGVKLKADYHTLYKTKPLDKPFRKGDVVKAELVCPGRMKGEMLAAAKGRAISIINCSKEKGSAKLKILKDKDNIFVAEEV
jgi:uncharacterized Fe-S cluster-containing radical SAM superfamily enzyme